MSKRIAMLIEFNYEDLEVWYPLLRFKEEGYEVVVVGPEKDKTYTSKHNYPCKSDLSIDDVSVETLDGVYVPGGFAPDYMRRNKLMVALVRDMLTAGKLVVTICHGAWMLCSAKCVRGRRLTCFHAIRDDVENAGAVYEDSAVVVDGNLITARIPSDLPQLCKAIIAKFKE